MFTERKITAFQHKIADLPDTPTLTASELKARFDACPEQLRQALNAVCDDGKALENRIDAYRAQTFTGEITETMLAEPLADKINAKATQTALAAETTARQNALAAEQSARDALGAALETQIAAKCTLVAGTYTGNGSTQEINLGFQPKAVLVLTRQYNSTYHTLANLALPGFATLNLEITANGFQVTNELNDREPYDEGGNPYRYLAFK